MGPGPRAFSCPGPAWLPLAGLPAMVFAASGPWPGWARMWAMAFAVFAGCKWLTWRRAIGMGLHPGRGRSAAYLAAWPGMDAERFLTVPGGPPAPIRPSCREICLALVKALCGGALVWLGVRRISEPLLAGWLGLLGLVFLLHFGFFHLVALLWRAMGWDAQPIMRAPLRASSLGEFWGRRWNLAFHQLAHTFLFRPMRGRWGGSGALLSTFLVSGLVHDAVISWPAGAGYGLPTAYFLAQGGGLLLERSEAGRRWGLGRGLRGRLYALIWVGAPAYWLFHPPFIERVILPFLASIGACGTVHDL